MSATMYSFKTDLHGAKRRFALRPGICTFDKLLATIGCKYARDRSTLVLATADTGLLITDNVSLSHALQHSHDTTTGKGCLKLTVREARPQEPTRTAAQQAIPCTPAFDNACSDSPSSSSSSSSSSSGSSDSSGSDGSDDDEEKKTAGAGQHGAGQQEPRLAAHCDNDDDDGDDDDDKGNGNADADADADGGCFDPNDHCHMPDLDQANEMDTQVATELREVDATMRRLEAREHAYRATLRQAKQHLMEIRRMKRTTRRRQQQLEKALHASAATATAAATTTTTTTLPASTSSTATSTAASVEGRAKPHCRRRHGCCSGHAGGNQANWHTLLPEGAIVTLATTTVPSEEKKEKKEEKEKEKKRDQAPLTIAAVDNGRARLIPATSSAAQRTVEFVVEHVPRGKLRLRNRNTGGYLRIRRDGAVDCRGRGGRFARLVPILESPLSTQSRDAAAATTTTTTNMTRGLRMYIGRIGRGGASHYMRTADTAGSELSSVEDARHAHALQVTVVGHEDPTGDWEDAAGHCHRRHLHRLHGMQAHHSHLHPGQHHHGRRHHGHHRSSHAAAHCPRFHDPHHLHPHLAHHHGHHHHHPFTPPTHAMPPPAGMFAPPPFPPPYSGAVDPIDKRSQQPGVGHSPAFPPPPPPPQYQPPHPASAYPYQPQPQHPNHYFGHFHHQQQHDEAGVTAATQGSSPARTSLDQHRQLKQQLKEERRKLKEERRQLKRQRKEERGRRKQDKKKDKRRSKTDKL